MKVRCINNTGYEQFLTVHKVYDVNFFYHVEETTYFEIFKDNGERGFFEAKRFLHSTSMK
jgi:hypothetical protein